MRIIYASIGLLLAGFTRIVGQIIGENICACSPSSYTFTLEFDLSCPPVNVAENEAVDDTSCVITSVGDPGVTDLVPVVVQSIDVLELGQGLRIIVQERITGTFVNGDSFNYTSIAAVPGDVVDPTDVPRAIQINIAAINQFDESLLNTFIITFSNSCDAYPVFTEGQSAGWVLFVSGFPVRHSMSLIPAHNTPLFIRLNCNLRLETFARLVPQASLIVYLLTFRQRLLLLCQAVYRLSLLLQKPLLHHPYQPLYLLPMPQPEPLRRRSQRQRLRR